MKRIVAVALITCGMVFVINYAQKFNVQGQTSDCRCVSNALSEIEKIKVGMVRKDLDKILSFDGGISRPNPQRFIHRQCDFIKIEIKFEFVSGSKKSPTDSPEDKITEISKPYLEHPFVD